MVVLSCVQNWSHAGSDSKCRAHAQFVECGALRQFHTVLSRCLASYSIKYDAVIVKMLDLVKLLEFAADNVWHTRNAQGSFAKTLDNLWKARKALLPKRDSVRPQHLCCVCIAAVLSMQCAEHCSAVLRCDAVVY